LSSSSPEKFLFSFNFFLRKSSSAFSEDSNFLTSIFGFSSIFFNLKFCNSPKIGLFEVCFVSSTLVVVLVVVDVVDVDVDVGVDVVVG